METKSFSFGAVLTMTTNCLFADFDEIYAIMRFMLGHPVATHEIPQYIKPCGVRSPPAVPGIGQHQSSEKP
jgi:hypothetical protein